MRIFICEDDPNLLARFSKIISQYLLFHDKEVSLALATTSPFAMLDFFKNDGDQNEDNLFFLDIDLKTSIDGVTLAVKIKKIYPNSRIVFITIHSEAQYLVFKYKIEAMDFILKNDLSKIREDIQACINLASNRFLCNTIHQEETILLKVNGVIKKIGINEIMFFETSTNAHKIVVHMMNRQIEFFGKLSELEEQNETLFRCHRATLINPHNIRSFDKKRKEIIFNNGERCWVSVRYLSLIKKIL
ncbi:MAG: LytR/AlgR family response regulator transcription factor [Enterococcus sp.]